MNIIIDACSIINLSNSGSIETVSGLQRGCVWLTPLVMGECGIGNAAELIAAEEGGCFSRLDESSVPTSRFLELMAQYNLGAGETECVAAAEALGFSVCTDDRQARNLAEKILGEGRVLGSARLLRWCVEEELLRCVDASTRFDGMKAAGGFLPKLNEKFFCVASG